MMKFLRQILILAAITVGFSLTAMAQKPDDQKKIAPKENRPSIPVKPKNDDNKKPDKPRDDKDDRRRPGMAIAVSSSEEAEA